MQQSLSEHTEKSMPLNDHEKRFLVLRRFREACRAFDTFQAKGEMDLNEKSQYVVAAQRYNDANKAYGFDDPDILIWPISEIIGLYDEAHSDLTPSHNDQLIYLNNTKV